MDLQGEIRTLLDVDLSQDRLFVDKEGHIGKKKKPNMRGRIVSWLKQFFVKNKDYSSQAIASRIVDIVYNKDSHIDEAAREQLKLKITFLKKKCHKYQAQKTYEHAISVLNLQIGEKDDVSVFDSHIIESHDTSVAKGSNDRSVIEESIEKVEDRDRPSKQDLEDFVEKHGFHPMQVYRKEAKSLSGDRLQLFQELSSGIWEEDNDYDKVYSWMHDSMPAEFVTTCEEKIDDAKRLHEEIVRLDQKISALNEKHMIAKGRLSPKEQSFTPLEVLNSHLTKLFGNEKYANAHIIDNIRSAQAALDAALEQKRNMQEGSDSKRIDETIDAAATAVKNLQATAKEMRITTDTHDEAMEMIRQCYNILRENDVKHNVNLKLSGSIQDHLRNLDKARGLKDAAEAKFYEEASVELSDVEDAEQALTPLQERRKELQVRFDELTK